MYCTKCGASIVNESLTSCPYCGAPVHGAYAGPSDTQPEANTAPPVAEATPPVYRAQENAYASAGPVRSAQGNSVRGRSIASMVLGIVSLVTAWFGWSSVLAIAAAVVGLVLGIQAKKTAPAGTPLGMATAGIVCSAIGLGLSCIVFVSCVLCAGAFGVLGASIY